jgi:hypothetical protein
MYRERRRFQRYKTVKQTLIDNEFRKRDQEPLEFTLISQSLTGYCPIPSNEFVNMNISEEDQSKVKSIQNDRIQFSSAKILRLPDEIIRKIFSCLTAKNVASFCFTTRELYWIALNQYLKDFQKYILYEQADEVESLRFILSRATNLDTIILDGRFRSCNHGKSTVPSILNPHSLNDEYFLDLKKQNRDKLKSIVLRACSGVGSAGILTIADTCTNLTALGNTLWNMNYKTILFYISMSIFVVDRSVLYGKFDTRATYGAP